MSGGLVELRDVSLGYNGRPVLEHVSLVIERGEFLALLGPNGAGKTTLLRGMLGLLPISLGEIAYGFDRRTTPPGYVPQRESLDPIFPLTAFEVVLMGTYARLPPLRPIGRHERALATRCLEEVDLADAARRQFWALSGGQKQRILIARALAVEPELLLLDEPTAGVDPAAEDAILNVIQRLNQGGLTVVLVSHQLRRVGETIRSVIWVDEGRVEKGPAETLLAPERLADFLGARVRLA